MTEKLHETLSALMDNEADDLELRRLLKELGDSVPGGATQSADALRAKWHRYHVVSACLKQEIHTIPSRNLLAGIRAELEHDSLPSGVAYRPVAARSGKGLWQVLGQGAIAASVAMAVLFTADLVMVADNEALSGAPTELAGTEAATRQLPGLTGTLNPATETRVAVQSVLDDEEMDRLQQVVSQELGEAVLTRQVPATFTPKETP